jgi:putative tricarboxylic transport membrane protein
MRGPAFTAFGLVFEPYVLLVIALSALFGLFVGAMPGPDRHHGHRAAGAGHLLHAAGAGGGGHRHGHRHGHLQRRHPGRAAAHAGHAGQAAYTDEAYAMTKKGQAELALGAGLVFSVLGGIFGVLVLIVAAPALAEVALKFSSSSTSGW